MRFCGNILVHCVVSYWPANTGSLLCLLTATAAIVKLVATDPGVTTQQQTLCSSAKLDSDTLNIELSRKIQIFANPTVHHVEDKQKVEGQKATGGVVIEWWVQSDGQHQYCGHPE